LTKKKPAFSLPTGPPKLPIRKLFCLENRTRLSSGVKKEIVGVECVVAEKLVGLAVELARAGFQNGVDVPPLLRPCVSVVREVWTLNS
jgi:hypothetical protein